MSGKDAVLAHAQDAAAPVDSDQARTPPCAHTFPGHPSPSRTTPLPRSRPGAAAHDDDLRHDRAVHHTSPTKPGPPVARHDHPRDRDDTLNRMPPSPCPFTHYRHAVDDDCPRPVLLLGLYKKPCSPAPFLHLTALPSFLSTSRNTPPSTAPSPLPEFRRSPPRRAADGDLDPVHLPLREDPQSTPLHRPVRLPASPSPEPPRRTLSAARVPTRKTTGEPSIPSPDPTSLLKPRPPAAFFFV